MNRSEEVLVDAPSFEMGAKDNSVERENNSCDFEKDVKQEKGESDYEPGGDSLSSQSNEDNKIKGASRVPKKLTRKESAAYGTLTQKSSSKRQDSGKVQFKTGNSGQKSAQKPSRGSSTPKVVNNKKSGDVKVPSKPPSELSEESDDKTIEVVKGIDITDEAPICDQSVGTDDETFGTDENNVEDDRRIAFQKIEEMEQKIDKLEEELREVAALEVSLYSMVPEHGNSAHKVHTPARRLSRLYIHACKHWTQDKRATVAKNTVSGLVLIAKSCGNDVSRLTYWLSNTVVLREIISQTFGKVSPSKSAASVQANGKKGDGKSPQSKWKNGSGEKQAKKSSFMQQVNDWQETSTFTTALEKIESWIFSRTVESVWWQVMEKCVSRLDVAMFNAILRESENDMPTDPVSDPIVDAKVLPIPAGDLSFGSGAQLKKSVK